ncbi:hypothetical protein [Nostoc sp. DedQUE09]|nr:hypothetical protein [Nostoc sp. DedQUE09]MDZ7955113.1 hypothetical protein [Nostoc sp. DedQUE09]
METNAKIATWRYQLLLLLLELLRSLAIKVIYTTQTGASTK